LLLAFAHPLRVRVAGCSLRSFFLNNALFSGIFLFFAFYALTTIDTLFNYTLSVLIAAAATWQLSNGAAPRT